MSRKRHSVDQIIGKLRQADVELGQGKTVEEACRALEITVQTYYRCTETLSSGVVQDLGVGHQEVFCSGLPMTVVTNDVTTEIWWDGKPVKDLMDASEPADSLVVGTMLRVWLDYRSVIFHEETTGTCPHDPLTVAEAVGERFVSFYRGSMVVHDDATTTFTPSEDGPHRAEIGIDGDRFLEWLSSKLTGDLS